MPDSVAASVPPKLDLFVDPRSHYNTPSNPAGPVSPVPRAPCRPVHAPIEA